MKYESQSDAYILFEDGLFMKGKSIGKQGTTGGEVCFNTGMTGYQEVYTDPSYYGQVIVNTSAHIGNYGTIDSEQESHKPQVSGIIVNEFTQVHSRQTAHTSLDEYLKKHDVVGITGLDTRKVVRHIRSKGAMNVVISSELSTTSALQERLNSIPSMEGLELASVVSTEAPYFRGEEWSQFKVAVVDFGIKHSILDNLEKRGCYLQIFPAKTSYQELMEWKPDGFFLSNGPGDPAAMDYAVATTKKIIESNYPVFGICLGHQIISLASGLTTFKMHHGHRGLNHPVKNLISGLGEITSQNHGFAVGTENLPNIDYLELTHINLNDETVEGIRYKNKPVFSVQYHPESSPGPHDSRYLFDEFIQMLNHKPTSNELN